MIALSVKSLLQRLRLSPSMSFEIVAHEGTVVVQDTDGLQLLLHTAIAGRVVCPQVEGGRWPLAFDEGAGYISSSGDAEAQWANDLLSATLCRRGGGPGLRVAPKGSAVRKPLAAWLAKASPDIELSIRLALAGEARLSAVWFRAPLSGFYIGWGILRSHAALQPGG